MMDILANNNWERPIYYASTTGSEAYLGLEDYFQLEGFAYRLVPIRTPRQSYSDIGRINSEVLYENLMNVFNDHSRIDRVNNPNAPAKEAYPYDWGGFNDPRVYHSEDNTRLVSMIRKIYDRLSGQLAAEGDLERAEQVLDKGNAIVPDEVFPYVSVMSNMYGYTQNSTFYMQDYFSLHTPSADKKGMEMAKTIWNEMVELFDWYNRQDEKTLAFHTEDLRYDFIFLHYFLHNVKFPSDELAAHYKELKMDHVAEMYIRSLTGSITKQIRKPDFDQQSVAGDFQELRQIMQIAEKCGDTSTMQKARQVAESQFTSLDAISPGLGGAFQRFFYGTQNEEEQQAEE